MKRRGRPAPYPIPWLPIDSRLIAPLFSFGHVHGLARFFLEIEIILAVLVVVGTLLVVMMSLL